jgi:hypothetical protein
MKTRSSFKIVRYIQCSCVGCDAVVPEDQGAPADWYARAGLNSLLFCPKHKDKVEKSDKVWDLFFSHREAAIEAFTNQWDQENPAPPSFDDDDDDDNKPQEPQ